MRWERIFRVLSSRKKCLFDNDNVAEATPESRNVFIFAFIVPKSNYIYATDAKKMKETATSTLATFFSSCGTNNVIYWFSKRNFNRKLNDIWIVYLELIHLPTEFVVMVLLLLPMMKSQSVFVTMKTTLSQFLC